MSGLPVIATVILSPAINFCHILMLINIKYHNFGMVNKFSLSWSKDTKIWFLLIFKVNLLPANQSNNLQSSWFAVNPGDLTFLSAKMAFMSSANKKVSVCQRILRCRLGKVVGPGLSLVAHQTSISSFRYISNLRSLSLTFQRNTTKTIVI